MIHREINQLLAEGQLDAPGLFPHLDQLKTAEYVFECDFGLSELPTEGGMLMVRGARQYGKSTWLENELCQTVKKFGAGSAYYLNAEYIANVNSLEQEIDQLTSGSR